MNTVTRENQCWRPHCQVEHGRGDRMKHIVDMANGWINEISQILENVLEKNEEQFIDVPVPQVQEHTVGKERILQIDEEVDEVLQKVLRTDFNN